MPVRPIVLLTVLTTLLVSATSTAQISLRDLPDLARKRADRLRPLQIAALEPFWADLSLDYETNSAILDKSIAKAAKLGDSVVPLLLEKLKPTQGGALSRNLAGNCRRVLQRLDPASFVDALAEMARGKNYLAKSQSIILLGYAEVPQAATVLNDLLSSAPKELRLPIIRSLRLLRSPKGAAQIVALLGSSDSKLREEVLAYLIAAKASGVVETVIQALETEGNNRLLPSYIDYFATCASRNAAATEALLPLLDRERIDWQDTRRLVRVLATIAPKGHELTTRKLHELIDGNDTSSLAVQAAVSLRDLGDKKGVRDLNRTLDDKIRRRKREAALYEQRASLLFAIDDFTAALSDYDKILDYSEGAAMTRRAYVGLLKCESRRNKIQSIVKHMKSSGMSPEEFQDLAEQDEPFRKSIEHNRVQSFLKQLTKDRAPK